MLSTGYPQASPLFNAFFFGTFLYLRGFRYILVEFYPSPGTTLVLLPVFGMNTYVVLYACT